jgi:hypothetical protein
VLMRMHPLWPVGTKDTSKRKKLRRTRPQAAIVIAVNLSIPAAHLLRDISSDPPSTWWPGER